MLSSSEPAPSSTAGSTWEWISTIKIPPGHRMKNQKSTPAEADAKGIDNQIEPLQSIEIQLRLDSFDRDTEQDQKHGA